MRLPSEARTALAVVVAVALHTAVAVAARPATTIEPELPPVDVELAPPPPEDRVEPPPPPAEPAKEIVASAAPAPRSAAAPAASPAARAGALLTAAPEAPRADDVVDFVTDPSGTSYGSGTVMRGGTAGRAEGPVTIAPARTESRTRGAAEGGDSIVAADHLSRRARLGDGDVCRGFFPRDAKADTAEVALVAVVRSNGSVASVSVASESPRGQGFGAAARLCLVGQRFDPALDESGRAVTSAPTVKVRFSR